METKEIVLPEGWEFDKFENGKIILKETKSKFSKSWKEFCERNKITGGECFISPASIIQDAVEGGRFPDGDKNVIPTKFANAYLALAQLLTIREKEYTKGWEPDWNSYCLKYVIYGILGKVKCNTDAHHIQRVLSFPTKELCKEFFENWKDLLEIAKPLL